MSRDFCKEILEALKTDGNLGKLSVECTQENIEKLAKLFNPMNGITLPCIIVALRLYLRSVEKVDSDATKLADVMEPMIEIRSFAMKIPNVGEPTGGGSSHEEDK